MFSASKSVKRRALVMSALAALFFAWFLVCERVVLRPEFIVELPIDRAIPFLPQFVIPYYLWYAYLILVPLWLLFRAPEDYVRAMTFFTLALLASCLIFTLAPNGQRLRPHTLGGGFFERWVAFTYSSDTPNNVAPSLHVLCSIGAHAALCHCERFRRVRGAVTVSAVVAVACSVSTVFIKQHSVLDVAMGVLLGAIIWAAVYGGTGARQRLGARVRQRAAVRQNLRGRG